jgi:tetratricopeptide (TPR) repeat protein
MLPRLSRSSGLLASRRQDVPARHETLRSAIDWSYALLKPEQQRLFRHLAVFAGGWRLEAAEAVCKDDGNVLDGLGVLDDSSLVQRVEDAGGSLCFRMLETVHEFALERLAESGETEAMRQAHTRYFVALAEELEPELYGPQQKAWLDYMEAEYPNQRAVLQRAIDSGDAETGLRLARALWVHAESRDSGTATEKAMFQESLALQRQIGNTWGAAKVLADVAVSAFHQDIDAPTALPLLHEALHLARSLGDKRLQAWVLLSTADVLSFAGHEDNARSLLAEARMLVDEVGDRTYLAWVLVQAANLATDATSAPRLGLEAVAIVRDMGHRGMTAVYMVGVAWYYAYAGEIEAAESYLQQALVLINEIGSRDLETWWYVYSARVASLRGDNGRVVSAARQALRLRAAGSDSGPAWQIYRYVLEDLAHRAVAIGDWQRVARLLGAVAAFDARTGHSRDRLDRVKNSLAALREHLSDPQVAAAWAEGQGMTMDQAGLRELKDLDEAMA